MRVAGVWGLLLVTSNNQGELTPLEIGLHALRAVPKAKGGKGQKGGLAEYSKIVGKIRQEVTLFFQAAEVYQEVKYEGYPVGLLKRAYHLAAIRRADKRAWSVLVSALIKDDWTVAETKELSPTSARLRLI